MKTSNKLLIAIGVLIVISMVSFDMALRAEYLKGDYKSPYYNMVSIPVKDFDAIEDCTSYDTFTEINTGAYADSTGNKQQIWISKEGQKDVAFAVKDRVLRISFKTPNSEQNRAYSIHIKCPRLNRITRGPTPGDKIMYESGNLTISVIKQDSIRIENKVWGIINLTPVYMKKVNVVMNQGSLNIGGNGDAEVVNFDIRNNSRVDIGNIKMGKVNYKLADSAHITLPGAAWNKISR